MSGFPLLLIPLAVCNIIVFLMPGVSFAVPLVTLPLMSGAAWTVTLSDALVALGLLLLLLEVQKSARPGGKYLTDHLLSLAIFAAAAAEFVMLPQFANATFFLLTLTALVDFLSGLALRGRRPKRLRETVVSEPIPQTVEIREPAPAVATVVAPAPRPVVEQPRPEAVSTEAGPLRVEPVIDMDPVEVPNARPSPTQP